MSPLTFLLIITLSQVYCGPTIHTYNSTTCDGFQATFDVRSLVGTWHVVAIIPEKLFPDRDVNCYRVEFSETDGAGLRWLINKTKPQKDITKIENKVDSMKGTFVRQRYHTEQAFDVWSRSIEGVNGCFQQVLSLDVGVNDTQKQSMAHNSPRWSSKWDRHKNLYKKKKAVTHDAMMQLHLMKTGDESGPFLVQMLWGRLISVVIYRRHQGVTQDQLKPVFELMSRLRGPQRLPKICDNPIRDLLFS